MTVSEAKQITDCGGVCACPGLRASTTQSGAPGGRQPISENCQPCATLRDKPQRVAPMSICQQQPTLRCIGSFGFGGGHDAQALSDARPLPAPAPFGCHMRHEATASRHARPTVSRGHANAIRNRFAPSSGPARKAPSMSILHHATALYAVQFLLVLPCLPLPCRCFRDFGLG